MPSFRQRSRLLVSDGPAFGLGAYLLLAMLLRLPAVLFADGFDFEDQQYQYIDPAWHLATGAAWHSTWEWADGMRSWVYPGFLSVIFRALEALGFTEPMNTMRAVRFVHALLSLLPIWLFWQAVVVWRPIEKPRRSLLLFAFSGLLVLQVQPSGPSLSGVLAVAAALAVHGPRWYPAFGGLCLGFAFCCRFQEALFGPGLLLVLCWQRRWSAAIWFSLACAPGILVQGLTDIVMGGSFLSTPLAYLQRNVGDDAASGWTQHPWWFYLLAGVVPVLALVPPCRGMPLAYNGLLRVAWQRLRAGGAVLPAALVAASVHVLAHSFISRKALRFEYCAFAMLLAVVSAGLPAVTVSSSARWHVRLLALVHTGLFLWASFWFANAGAVRSTLWLREHGDASGEVLVVGGPVTAMGGAFYLRARADRLRTVALDDLPALLQRGEVKVGGYLVAPRHKLDLGRLPAPVRLELVAEFSGQFDLRKGERRFVYRRLE